MFLITETEAAAIQQILLNDGELSAEIELRCRYPGIDNLVAARRCVRALVRVLHAPVQQLPEPINSAEHLAASYELSS